MVKLCEINQEFKRRQEQREREMNLKKNEDYFELENFWIESPENKKNLDFRVQFLMMNRDASDNKIHHINGTEVIVDSKWRNLALGQINDILNEILGIIGFMFPMPIIQKMIYRSGMALGNFELEIIFENFESKNTLHSSLTIDVDTFNLSTKATKRYMKFLKTTKKLIVNQLNLSPERE